MSTAQSGTSTTFASRATLTRTNNVNSQTVRYGTVLQPGESAVYPSHLYTAVPQSSGGSGSSLNGGAIAGIVVGSVAGALLIALLIFLFVMNRRKAAKKEKRQSRTHLLPTTTTSPDMVQRTAPSYNTLATGTSAAAVAVPVASHQKKPYIKKGLQFGSGHRRHDSGASTTAFLAGSGNDRMSTDQSRMSLDSSFNTSPTRDRFSYATTASTDTANVPRFQGQYGSERASIEEEPPTRA